MTLRFRTDQIRSVDRVNNARFDHGRFGRRHSAAARPALAPPPTACSPSILDSPFPRYFQKPPLWSHQVSRRISTHLGAICAHSVQHSAARYQLVIQGPSNHAAAPSTLTCPKCLSAICKHAAALSLRRGGPPSPPFGGLCSTRQRPWRPARVWRARCRPTNQQNRKDQDRADIRADKGDFIFLRSCG